jgi:hypothetical protein
MERPLVPSADWDSIFESREFKSSKFVTIAFHAVFESVSPVLTCASGAKAAYAYESPMIETVAETQKTVHWIAGFPKSLKNFFMVQGN